MPGITASSSTTSGTRLRRALQRALAVGGHQHGVAGLVERVVQHARGCRARRRRSAPRSAALRSGRVVASCMRLPVVEGLADQRVIASSWNCCASARRWRDEAGAARVARASISSSLLHDAAEVAELHQLVAARAAARVAGSGRSRRLHAAGAAPARAPAPRAIRSASARPASRAARDAHRLGTKSSGAMPTSLSRPLSKALAETIAIGASLRRCARSARIVSQPSMPGIARSIRIASGRHSRSSARHSWPDAACAPRSRAARAGRPAASRSTSSLSTTSTRRRAPRVADARGARQLARGRARRAARAGTGGCGTRVPLRPASLRHRHLAAHQVGQHLADRQAQAGAAARRRAGVGAAREGLEDALDLVGGDAGAGVLDLEHAPSRARSSTRNSTCPTCVNLTALPSTLMRIWRSRFSSARTTSGSALGQRVLEGEALGRGLQLEHAHDLAARSRESASAWGRAAACRPRCARCRACLRSGTAGARRRGGSRSTACWRCGGIDGVLLQQLRVAEDAVERRAQLVAQVGDVAALGLVGELGGCAWPAAAAASVRRCDSISRRSACVCSFSAWVWRFDSSCATWRLLCVSTSHQATMPLTSSSAAKALRKPSRSAARAPAALLAAAARSSCCVEHAEQAGQQRHDHRHQQQVVAEAGVDVGPGARAAAARAAAPFHCADSARVAACTGRGSARRACSTASRSAPP